MKTKKVCIFITFLIIAFPACLLFFGIESNPLVLPGRPLSVDDIDRAKKLAKVNSPGSLKSGEIKSLQIPEQDLNALLQYALSRLPRGDRFSSEVKLEKDSADIFTTFTIPPNPVGSYVNVSLSVKKKSDGISVSKLRIGSIPIAGFIINPCFKFVHNRLKNFSQYQGIAELKGSIKDINFQENELLLVYKWQPEMARKLKARGREFLLSKEDRERLLAYNDHLVAISKSFAGKTMSLAEYLNPLFKVANERTISGADPASENRAVIFTLALYVLQKPVTSITGNSRGSKIPKPKRKILTLRNRSDLAQHFMVSAAITAAADSKLADVIGLFKEVDDSRGGSGFSFADLTADRAGVRFSELITGSIQKARLLQEQIGRSIMEQDFMPPIDMLPEGIMELEFKKRYRDLDSDAYKRVHNEIERRIDSCSIYRH